MIKKVTYDNKDLISLINELDQELRDNFEDLQDTYDQFNSLKPLSYIIIYYENEEAIACGSFKEYTNEIIEIKRMFVSKSNRGKGLSKLILNSLEDEARRRGFIKSRLETGDKLLTAISLYEKSGYNRIENYDQYIGMKTSFCFEKNL